MSYDVKPLEWRSVKNKNRKWSEFLAETAHGFMVVTGRNGEGWFVGMCRDEVEDWAVGKESRFETLAKAKAFAQEQHAKEISKWLKWVDVNAGEESA